MLKEFKEFALKGNVVDLAVAVVIGTAFGKIVSSMVADIIMPIIAFLTSGVNFTKMQATFGDVTITYGNFIQSVVDFVIVAFCIFIVVKLINKTKKKEAAEAAVAEPPKPTEQELLAEIRDLLKSK
jgi:large conductance mechanosensitive channel